MFADLLAKIFVAAAFRGKGQLSFIIAKPLNDHL
jgi:hypothetical protein